MKRSDVLVIGSSAAGLVAALTARMVNPDKTVTVIRRENKCMVPCGIPYAFGSLTGTDQNVMPAEKMFETAGVELVIDDVVSIDRSAKVCRTGSGEEIAWEKLVLATGSTPVRPRWLKGCELDGVFTVPKDKDYLDMMKSSLAGCKRVVVIGAGFIGVEFSDELVKAGYQVELVEQKQQVLAQAFDTEIAERAGDLLKARGVSVRLGVGVSELIGDTHVHEVRLANGDTLLADAVVLAVGYEPNTSLAAEAGITITSQGTIRVDEYMRTNDPNIFAAGDCAEKRDFVTRKTNTGMLASTACAEARTAGMNLFKLSLVKTFSGTISIFATALGDTGFGIAGLTEAQARAEGFDVVTSTFEGMDKHPGSLPGTHKQLVKLIVGREAGVILGGEVVGGASTGELTNCLGFIIQNRMNVFSLLTSQIGSHPLLTASPAAYPLIQAAGMIVRDTLGR